MSAINLVKCFTFILVLLLSQGSHAKQPKFEVGSANSFFSHYLDSYNAFDSAAAANHYNQQVMVTGIGKVPQLLTKEQMQNLLTRFLAGQKANNVKHFEWEVMNVHSLSDSVAIASNVASRFDSQRKLVDKAAATFTATKIDQHWKIVALNIHLPENIIPKG